MHNIDIYKKLIRNFQDCERADPERLKFILGDKTKLEYLNEWKENMHIDICEWQRWYSKLNTLIDKEK